MHKIDMNIKESSERVISSHYPPIKLQFCLKIAFEVILHTIHKLYHCIVSKIHMCKLYNGYYTKSEAVCPELQSSKSFVSLTPMSQRGMKHCSSLFQLYAQSSLPKALTKGMRCFGLWFPSTQRRRMVRNWLIDCKEQLD
jgi:hypothetical protein